MFPHLDTKLIGSCFGVHIQEVQFQLVLCNVITGYYLCQSCCIQFPLLDSKCYFVTKFCPKCRQFCLYLDSNTIASFNLVIFIPLLFITNTMTAALTQLNWIKLGFFYIFFQHQYVDAFESWIIYWIFDSNWHILNQI